ncbi:MAG: hypothetical protein ABJH98_05935 [Reichenbachiella sp.]|uniref:hypothetical protein n=1 Tax=Reichenbachiella sp. TaxID=2184521 RepID=UPI0032978314
MGVGEYYLAFESILYGLIVSRILIKWSEMANTKATAIYWEYIILTINVFLLIVNVYWANRFPEHYEAVTNPLMFLLVVVVPPSLFTFMTYQMFPNEHSNKNLKAYLIDHRKKIFIPWTAFMVYEIAVLSDVNMSPYIIGAASLLVITIFMIKSPKMIWIHLFLIIHTLLITIGYLRAYML